MSELINYEPNSCSCNHCKMMCYVSPCFPTPDDVINLINAGYEDQLAPTLYIDLSKIQKYQVIAPKSKAMLYTKEDGEQVLLHKCNFLNENNLCSLHDKGLKPTEGRLAKCGNSEEKAVQLRVAVCNTWTNIDQKEKAEKLFKFFE